MNDKICHNCGRNFEWRKKWKEIWHEVKYCSKKCQRDRLKDSLKEKIMSLVNERGKGKSICPSEVLPLELKQNKNEMEQVRMAARLLAHSGLIEILQKGKRVDPSTFRGPVRLRLKA